MKSLLIASLLFVSIGAQANHHEEWDKLPFAQKKSKLIDKLDKKSEMIKNSKSCVENAKDDAALKACKESMKEQKKAMKKKHKKDKKKK